MIQLPPHLYKQYRTYCVSNGVQGDRELADYLKWLRFFLDFCEKYAIAGDEAERLRQFQLKLKQKQQSDVGQQQAKKAVSFYFSMIRRNGTNPLPSEQHIHDAEPSNKRENVTEKPLPAHADEKGGRDTYA